MRPLRILRHEGLLQGAQIGLELLQGRGGLGLEALDVVADRDRVAVLAEGPQLLELGLELGDGLFEIEIAAHQTAETKRPAPTRSPAGRRGHWRFGAGKSRFGARPGASVQAARSWSARSAAWCSVT